MMLIDTSALMAILLNEPKAVSAYRARGPKISRSSQLKPEPKWRSSGAAAQYQDDVSRIDCS